jgi:hypothetical protein
MGGDLEAGELRLLHVESTDGPAALAAPGASARRCNSVLRLVRVPDHMEALLAFRTFLGCALTG